MGFRDGTYDYAEIKASFHLYVQGAVGGYKKIKKECLLLFVHFYWAIIQFPSLTSLFQTTYGSNIESSPSQLNHD